MRDPSRLLFAAGLICAVLGIVLHKGLVAVAGVVLLIGGLLLRLLKPRPAVGTLERSRFGPTTVASTVAGDASRSFDVTPRD